MKFCIIVCAEVYNPAEIEWRRCSKSQRYKNHVDGKLWALVIEHGLICWLWLFHINTLSDIRVTRCVCFSTLAVSTQICKNLKWRKIFIREIYCRWSCVFWFDTVTVSRLTIKHTETRIMDHVSGYELDSVRGINTVYTPSCDLLSVQHCWLTSTCN